MHGSAAPHRGSDEMTRYLISFDEGAMTFPEEEPPTWRGMRMRWSLEAMDAGAWFFGGGLDPRGAERGGDRRDRHRRPVSAEQGIHRRIDDRLRALTRGGAGAGRQARRPLPLCSTRPRVHALPGLRNYRGRFPVRLSDVMPDAVAAPRACGNVTRPLAVRSDWCRRDTVGVRAVSRQASRSLQPSFGSPGGRRRGAAWTVFCVRRHRS